MSQDKMTAANDFLANVLKCPRCEGDCLTISHDKAVCNVCSAQFPIMNGVPILYEEGCSNSKLQYCSTPPFAELLIQEVSFDSHCVP